MSLTQCSPLPISPVLSGMLPYRNITSTATTVMASSTSASTISSVMTSASTSSSAVASTIRSETKSSAQTAYPTAEPNNPNLSSYYLPPPDQSTTPSPSALVPSEERLKAIDDAINSHLEMGQVPDTIANQGNQTIITWKPCARRGHGINGAATSSLDEKDPSPSTTSFPKTNNNDGTNGTLDAPIIIPFEKVRPHLERGDVMQRVSLNQEGNVIIEWKVKG